MKTFLDEDFLLDTRTAVELFHSVAARQPILDYHCHLSPQQVADNHRFRSITEIWLDGDHYKWRAMRADGVPERAITGEATDWEKFEAWARTVPHTLRNPLYHWTHLELRFPFGLRKLLSPDTAREIFDHCNRRLTEDDFTTQGLLRQFDVRVVCSTDDPIDDLAPHRRHAQRAGAFTQLLPTWRPDRALALHDLAGWNSWVDALGAAAGASIATLDELRAALAKRQAAFHAAGCRASDHGLERIHAADYTEREAAATFAKARAGQAPSPDEIEKLRSALLFDLAVMDHKFGWVQQFHLGALRDTSARGMKALGPNTGYDAIGDFPQAVALARFLDRLDAGGTLAKTIVYNLNPADNEAFATVIGSFQDGSAPGKMQLGSAWWFLDQLDGMRKQIDALSNLGLLARFVGMLTDSRSFLSFSRHEYFRRLLCNMIGQDVERGLIPNDRLLLGNLVEDVCFRNARDYFKFAV
ncbi:MAG TPA: glucuronate isomerase [Polyangia bacterium]|nr:glucuronate isomerase [Polyangia bacterium]